MTKVEMQEDSDVGKSAVETEEDNTSSDAPSSSNEKPKPGFDSDNNDVEATRPSDTSSIKENAASEEFEVLWTEPADEDPDNPMNWKPLRKWCVIGVVSFVTFLTPLASSMFAPGVPAVMNDFHSSSSVLGTFVVSVYVLGFAFGPLVVAPVCEIVGRTPVYHVCNILFLIFTILNAVAVNMPMLIAFRFLAGFAGVGAITIGSGTIADIMPPERRGLAMSMWSMGPLFGPIVGPIAGGYIAEDLGWRWVFWIIAIATGLTTVVCFFILSETYAPKLLEKKAARLRKDTGNPAYHVRLTSSLTHNQLLKQSIVRPMKILFFSPIASLMCVYIAVLYGLLYILFTTFTFVFNDQYNFSTSSAGLSFLGSGVGTLIGLAYAATLSDRIVKRKLADNLKPQPEDRLPLYMVLPGSLSIPIGLFIYGWSANYKIHWIVPELGTAITGFGMIVILMCIQTYLVDTYTIHAASAIAANTVLRSLLGALLPLAGTKIYDAMGLGWGNTLLGMLALVIAPIPVLFGLFGKRLRTRPGFNVRAFIDIQMTDGMSTIGTDLGVYVAGYR